MANGINRKFTGFSAEKDKNVPTLEVTFSKGTNFKKENMWFFVFNWEAKVTKDDSVCVARFLRNSDKGSGVFLVSRIIEVV